MLTQDTTIEIRDNAYETIPAVWWDWPEEALPTDPTEMADRLEQAQWPIEDDSEYVNLYFLS
jgi:hypothetical protein